MPFDGEQLYASSFALRGTATSKRDDMISIGLLLISLLDKLPYEDWYQTQMSNFNYNIKKELFEKKSMCTVDDYCSSPHTLCLKNYMQTVLSL